MKYVILIVCFVSTLSCTRHNVSYTIDKEWTKDSIGILNLRSKALAEKIIKKYSMYDEGVETFIKVFGRPNMRKKTLFTDDIVYFSGMGGEVAENAEGRDTCFIIFHFNLNSFCELREVCQ